MFDIDKWSEIFATMIKNPLRTFLTGLSVGLGIFILVVMQGLGFGLQNGVMAEFNDDAINSLWIRSGSTSIPYAGMKANRNIEYENKDLDLVRDMFGGKDVYSGRVSLWNANVKFQGQAQNFGVRSVHPGHQELEKTILTEGRFINETDIAEERKVAVVGQTILDDLFRGTPALNQYIEIAGVNFKVIGTFSDPNGRWENRQIYLPITSGQKIFGRNDKVDMFILSTGDRDLEETIEMSEKIEAVLKDRHKVHPDDTRAIWVRNNNEEFSMFLDIFKGIEVFIWGIGFFTLFAGMIGVANIMAIVVKERTKEIGIRKALGAPPITIISQIIQESTFLTFVSGCIGLILGIICLNVLAAELKHDFFSNPRVSPWISLGALGLLIFVGVFAGLIPAIRAAHINPVEALRDE